MSTATLLESGVAGLSPGAAAVEVEVHTEPSPMPASHDDGRVEPSKIFLELQPFDELVERARKQTDA